MSWREEIAKMDLEDIIKLYAYYAITSGAARIVLHERLCELLEVPHYDFQPFEDANWNQLPTSVERERFLREQIHHMQKLRDAGVEWRKPL